MWRERNKKEKRTLKIWRQSFSLFRKWDLRKILRRIYSLPQISVCARHRDKKSDSTAEIPASWLRAVVPSEVSPLILSEPSPLILPFPWSCLSLPKSSVSFISPDALPLSVPLPTLPSSSPPSQRVLLLLLCGGLFETILPRNFGWEELIAKLSSTACLSNIQCLG